MIPEKNCREKFSYRKKIQPTGEEVNSIVKFNRLVMLNAIEKESVCLQAKISKGIKIVAAISVTGMVAVIAVLLMAVFYLK